MTPIFYTGHLQLWYLLAGFAVLSVIWLCGRRQVQSKLFYFVAGGVVWYCFLHSGIHPTIAGVLVACCIPARPMLATSSYIAAIRGDISRFPQQAAGDDKAAQMLNRAQIDRLKRIESASDRVISPLQAMEDMLHPIVNFFIIPLFAFANAGIDFSSLHVAALWQGVAFTVFVSLVAGKFVGIFSFTWLAVRLGLSRLPAHTSWGMLAGAAILGGIGFTVALFIANLSFAGGPAAMQAHLGEAKLGIVAASVVAGVAGYAVLRLVSRKAPRH